MDVYFRGTQFNPQQTLHQAGPLALSETPAPREVQWFALPSLKHRGAQPRVSGVFTGHRAGGLWTCTAGPWCPCLGSLHPRHPAVLPCENHPDPSSIRPGRHSQPHAAGEKIEAKRLQICLWSRGWKAAVQGFGE